MSSCLASYSHLTAAHCLSGKAASFEFDCTIRRKGLRALLGRTIYHLLPTRALSTSHCFYGRNISYLPQTMHTFYNIYRIRMIDEICFAMISFSISGIGHFRDVSFDILSSWGHCLDIPLYTTLQQPRLANCESSRSASCAALQASCHGHQEALTALLFRVGTFVEKLSPCRERLPNWSLSAFACYAAGCASG